MDILLYMHNGSANHGCEALARTISGIFSEYGQVRLFSKRPEEDRKYIDDASLDIVKTNVPVNTHSVSGIITALKIKYLKQKYAFVKPSYKSLLDSVTEGCVAVSIGGDNYCYDGMPEVLSILNREINRRGGKTVLWGCSIEPSLLENDLIVSDLSSYSLIAAREEITYKALTESRVNTKIVKVTDSAFLLPAVYEKLPDGFIEGNTVGVNISPLVLSLNNGNRLLFDAYRMLIKNITERTDMNVALIPHVVWEKNNDMQAINELYEEFKDSKRVIKLGDANACVLKGYISRCRFFVGARTHATIAAYSSLVPTLVVGYSVKSMGIATDLFGDYTHYVLKGDELKSADELYNSFEYIYDNENEIKQRLASVIPEYKEKTKINLESIMG